MREKKLGFHILIIVSRKASGKKLLTEKLFLGTIRDILTMGKAIFLILLFAFLSLASPVASQTKTPKISDPVSASLAEGKLASSSADFIVPLEIYLKRTYASEGRLAKVGSKIAARLNKMKKSAGPVTKLVSSYNGINQKLTQLKKDLKKVQGKAETLIVSTNPENDYKVIRPDLIKVNNNLKTILEMEKNLIIQMKPYFWTAASVSAAASPKR